jgi:hypothetical protein
MVSFEDVFNPAVVRKTADRICRRLLPNASDSELEEATETFIAYMELTWRIHVRMTRERKLGKQTEE